MSNLVGKHIVCHLESSAGNTPPFSAEVRRGRHEGEVYLLPHGEGTKGYVETNRIYVREMLKGPPDGAPPPETPSNITPMPPGGNEPPPAASVVPPPPTVPVMEIAPTEAEAPPPPAGESSETPPPPAAEQPELTDRRLSESPISPETRKKRGRGSPADHGTAAAQPDEYQEKT